MERNAIEALKQWKEDRERKPLVLNLADERIREKTL